MKHIAVRVPEKLFRQLTDPDFCKGAPAALMLFLHLAFECVRRGKDALPLKTNWAGAAKELASSLGLEEAAVDASLRALVAARHIDNCVSSIRLPGFEQLVIREESQRNAPAELAPEHMADLDPGAREQASTHASRCMRLFEREQRASELESQLESQQRSLAVWERDLEELETRLFRMLEEQCVYEEAY